MKQRDYVNLKTQEAKKKRIDLNPPLCRVCNRVIPKPRRYNNNVAYCNDEHAREGRMLVQRQRLAEQRLANYQKKLSTEELEGGFYPEDQVRRGPLYERIKAEIATHVLDDWVDRKITDVEMRSLLSAPNKKLLGFTSLGMVRRALFNDRLIAIQASHHKMGTPEARLLGPPDATMRALALKDPALYQKKLDDLLKAFVKWRARYFPDYITKEVHERWIRAILDTIYTGGRTLILSPPRHGKTELLIHFAVWGIIRTPDIRILWVGPNTEIAVNCLGLVQSILENHDDLKRSYLAPGETWAPASRVRSLWQSDKFTVGTRKNYKKQPTMWAAGVQGKLLSIDADWIIVDDPADPDHSYTPSGRDRIENWFKVKLISRKMVNTGLCVIASRVHVLDLFSQFIESPLWKVLIDKAHDSAICGLDLHTPHPGGGVSEGCVLFPEVNPLQYLREQHDVVGDALFEMMYLNQPRPDGTLIFDPDLIRMRCFHPGRNLGTAEIRGPFRLVAGLDPAAKGVQAAFLWAVQSYEDPDTRKIQFLYHMVDVETQQGGGLEGAERIMRQWKMAYGNLLWVVEDNAFQGVFFTDLRFKRFCDSEGIVMKPASTQNKNKFDQWLGLTAMATDYHEGRVILPYATTEARRKTDSLVRQLVNWTGDTGPTKAGKSDILMASWFPFATVIRRWLKQARAEAAEASPVPINSYPTYGQPTYDQLPWPAASYLGETG